MRSAVLGLACLCSACGGAAPARPTVPLAAHWSAPPASVPQPSAADARAPAFWDRFQSAELRELLLAAAEYSLEGASAAARAAQNEALQRVARAPLYPTLSAEAAFLGQSENGNSYGRIGGAFLDVGLTAQYEPDLWGRTRGTAAAAKARGRASVYDRANVELAVAAGVAETYFEVLSLRERITRRSDNLGAMRRILDLVEAKVRAGVALEREVAQQRALVASETARVEQIAQSEGDARVALAIVSGREPLAIDVRARSLDDVADPVVVMADVDVPERLLTRRPDVARAEAQLTATNADVDAARASLLPQLSLVGSVAYQNVFLSEYYDGSSVLYSGQVRLSQPIYDGGAHTGERDAAAARRVEAEADYKRTVIAAVGEVERALRALDSLQKQLEQRKIVVDEARRAFGLVESEYKAGAVELLVVLEAQRTLFQAEDEFSQTRLAKLRAAASLVKALGGGWSRE